jgi:hypothetical protein
MNLSGLHNVTFQKLELFIEPSQFGRKCGQIRTPRQKTTLHSSQLNFYNVMAMLALIYASEELNI